MCTVVEKVRLQASENTRDDCETGLSHRDVCVTLVGHICCGFLLIFLVSFFNETKGEIEIKQ